MTLPVIESHLMGSSGLYGTSIGAPGIPLAMGIQVTEQNGVHILKKPPIPPINVVKGSANPVIQVNNVRKRRKIFPELEAQMMSMGGSMPQSLIGNNTMLPGVMGTTVMPPIPMVSPMGMTGMPQMMNQSNNIMPGMLPQNTMMGGSSLGMGTAPPIQQNNNVMDSMSAAMGLALMQGSNRGSGFPQDPPIMMQDDYHNMSFDKNYQEDNFNFNPFEAPDNYMQNSRMRQSNNINQQMGNLMGQLIPGHQQEPDYFNQQNFQQSPHNSHINHSQHDNRPIIINQPPQQPPVVIIQQPNAPPPVQNNTSLIDKVGLITGMVMAQKNAGRSQQIQNLQIAQLNQLKQQQQNNRSMMQTMMQQRSMLEQDRNQFMRSQMYGQNSMGLGQSTTYPLNMNGSRTSLATNQEQIRVVIFPKCKPQIFSSKNMV